MISIAIMKKRALLNKTLTTIIDAEFPGAQLIVEYVEDINYSEVGAMVDGKAGYVGRNAIVVIYVLNHVDPNAAKIEAIATICHEIAHLIIFKPTLGEGEEPGTKDQYVNFELKAWSLGIPLARKYNVLPEYYNDARLELDLYYFDVQEETKNKMMHLYEDCGYKITRERYEKLLMGED